MVFLADSFFEYNYIQKAANIAQSVEILPVLQTMTDLQLMILVFFTIKFCLTVSQYINLEL